MNVTKNEIVGILGIFGLSGGAQILGEDGGLVSPEFLTNLAETIPLPYLAVVGVIAYLVLPKLSPMFTRAKLPPVIVCSSCDAIIGHVEDDK